MTDDIKGFFRKMKKCNDSNLFLFYQFYLNPKSALGGSDDNTMDNYYNHGNIKHLVNCDDFFEFLNLCMYDETFVEKLENDGINNNLLLKIRYIIFDIEEYKKHYFKDLEDENFRNYFKGIISIGEHSKKYSIWELCGLLSYYEKCGWLYETGLTCERALNISDDTLKNLKFMSSFFLDVYHEKYIEPLLSEEIMISEINNGKYSGLARVFCFWEDGYLCDKKAFKALVCSNKFLDLCNKELINRDLSYNVLRQIINLLEMSIAFHVFDFDLEYEWLYNLVGEKRINDYNVDFAEAVLDKVEDKIMSSKVLQLY